MRCAFRLPVKFHTHQFASIHQFTTMHCCSTVYLQHGGGGSYCRRNGATATPQKPLNENLNTFFLLYHFLDSSC